MRRFESLRVLMPNEKSDVIRHRDAVQISELLHHRVLFVGDEHAQPTVALCEHEPIMNQISSSVYGRPRRAGHRSWCSMRWIPLSRSPGDCSTPSTAEAGPQSAGRSYAHRMFQVQANELMRFQGGDGQPLARLVDAILRAELARAAVDQCNIQTDHKSHGDGGVDTSVAVAVPDDRFGYLRVPSCWQYKGIAQRGLTAAKLRKEIHKGFCTSLIQKGFGWRLVVPDEIPANKRAALLNAARIEIRKLCSSAPEPHILTSSDLANWLSDYPSLVLRFFPVPNTEILHVEAWKDTIQRDTPTYVEIPSWSLVRAAIERHCDLLSAPGSVVLAIQGAAGVGKTRLAFKTISRMAGVSQLVVYTANAASAEHVAYHLARTRDVRCLLVVDECAPSQRVILENLLNGPECKARVRVIALDNSGLQPIRASSEALLAMMDADELAHVLAANFPQVAKDRRRAYSEVSEGFVRMAADLCVNDPLASSPSIQISGGLHQYVADRLGGKRQGIEAIALVWRVGFRDAIKSEFETLCQWLNIDAHTTRAQLREIKERPGFAKDAGRYLYVTPEIVSKMAFQWAWERWADHDQDSFLASVPDNLLDVFLKRVERSAEPAVRRVVGAYFRQWMSSLTAPDLVDANKVKRITLFVEADLDTSLPILERLVLSASLDELCRVSGRGPGGWGPRRHLVWLIERVVRLPQYFHAAEAILRRLALAESEPEITNNATAIYRQLFHIYLSGTAIPFHDRSMVLERILDADSPEEKLLAIACLEGALADQPYRSGGPTFVAGRLPPDEWRPTTQMELASARAQALAQLIRASADASAKIATRALRALALNARRLLSGGFLPELRNAFGAQDAVTSHASELLREINSYLRWDTGNERLSQGADYVCAVRQWAEELVPNDLQGRLIRFLGGAVSLIDVHNNAEWNAGVEQLAVELVVDAGTLGEHIDWLCSDRVRGVAYIGAKMGRLDTKGQYLEQIVDAAVRTGETGLAQGYCASYAKQGMAQAHRISLAIDGIEQVAPSVAFEISTSVESLSRCVARTLRGVEAGRLSSAFLCSHRFTFGSEALADVDAEGLLHGLLRASAAGDKVSLRGSAQMLGSWVQPNGQRALFENLNVRELAWQILEAASNRGGAEQYHWGESVQYLARFDPHRAVRLCVEVLAADSLHLADEAQAELSRLAQEHSVEVIAELGKLMLDEKRGWRFQVGTLRGLISGLPVQELMAWLSRVGVRGARSLARHLPAPSVDHEGRAVLHPLTEYVLTAFADDDKTFSAFATGTHCMQVYRGDISAQHQAEADAARLLLNHPLRRVREWAAREVQSGEEDAERWRWYEDESSTDF